ncbi:MAG: ion transporter [Saprospiraceae bacterium]
MLKRFFTNERNMLGAVFLNAIVIFALYFPSLRDEHWLTLIDHFFLLLFVVEAIVKLYVYKPKGYFADPWNRFDLVIVLASLPALALPYADLPDTGLIIILRLFRLVRLVRFLRFIPNLNHVLAGLKRALKASVFVLLVLVFLNFLIALITCHFYAEVAPEYFGDPLLSVYSIFQLFTLEGWNEIPALIAQRTETVWMVGFTRLYFVVVVLLGGIFGMSLANAVFVDEMTMDNNRDLERKIDALHEELRELKEILREK